MSDFRAADRKARPRSYRKAKDEMKVFGFRKAISVQGSSGVDIPSILVKPQGWASARGVVRLAHRPLNFVFEEIARVRGSFLVRPADARVNLAESWNQRSKDLALPAKTHLLFPVVLNLPLARGTVDKPA